MSNTQKKNVPELRFPGFEGEWEEKSISSFLKESKIKGSNGSHAKKLTVKLWGKGVVPKKETFKGSDNTQYYKRKAGQLMYGKLDFLNCAFGIVPDSLNNYESTIDSPSFDFINGDSKFLLERIKLKSFYKKFGDIANGSRKAKRINQDTFLSLPVFAPKYNEQLRIGEFFSKLDRQIELQEQKLELLQQQKKGYMQKIFSQELRFKDENGEDYPDWKEKKLGDITEQSMYGIGASATRFDSKNIYIRITDIDEKSRKLNYQNLTTPDELNNKYKLKRNDILFARTGASTGKSYIHKEEKDIYNYYFAGFLIKFEIDEQNNPLFIYQFTLTSKYNKWVKVMSVRSGQPGINSEEYAKLPLVLPNKLEQQKIAEFLDRFDQQIELEKQKIEILQQQKKGLLQSMFI